ncbi:MAG TPA: 2-oxoglutarate dehydrogenase E1 component [Nevskiaceae bacterium]|nr:2-oxoglutarate dehydrogenase E1 component [Nevskiaceae bacterium]
MTGEIYRSFIESSSIQGANATYIESLYEDYLADPGSVEASWRAYFESLHQPGDPPEQAEGPVRQRFEQLARAPHYAALSADAAALEKQAAVLRLINHYRQRGHQAASLDPLGLVQPQPVQDLDPGHNGLSASDMQTEFNTGTLATAPRMKLAEIIRVLKAVYSDTVAAQYMYVTETAQKRWIQNRLEGHPFAPKLKPEEQREVLGQLVAAEGLERYLGNKYVGQKRFSLEGGDALIPLLDEAMRVSVRAGVEDVMIGMAHRGRLNVLVNVLGKAPALLFAEFDGKHDDEPGRAGDVKYHMGFSADVELEGRRLHTVLAFNPSHLEYVNPVVEGSVKARQARRRDELGERVVPILIHGDSAFSGQGIVMETLQLAYSKGYATGGTVHVMINNQIGFTTSDPIETRVGRNSRSSRYCTDLAKMLEAPVFHVNGDDPEAVVFVTRIAVDFRNTFHRDVLIDVCCYRRHGHNEADEPMVTQPLMYAAIKAHPTTMAIYGEKLTKTGVIAAGELDKMVAAYRDGLDRGENIARKTLGMIGNEHTVDWSKYIHGRWDDKADTCVPKAELQTLAHRLLELPEGFTVHPRVAKILQSRAEMADGKLKMDWGFAETLAYATLVDDGYAVRLSGEDTRRGTFFHRHASLFDTKTGSSYTPLKHLDADKMRFVVNDSLLSEAGVLGFEYGYSSADPDTLVIWEAQFGDFANGAQVFIDQFIASGMAKWGRYCGLVLFLPHGYEGQGPEHSSGRLERYLQLCAGDNMQVCVPSTPAQMFHLLRRQMKRNLRIPLVAMTPKSLLRHKLSVSTLEDLSDRGLQLIIPDREADPKKVKRVVFCAGKVYYDLYEARAAAKLNDVALCRIEQLYPFPHEAYKAAMARFPKAKDVVWAQEEPENQGAWYQIKHRLKAYLPSGHRLFYATRPGTSTTAVGYFKVHVQEQTQLVEAALTGGVELGGGA